MDGKLVMNSFVEIHSNPIDIPLKMKEVASGSYVLRLFDNNGIELSRQFIVEK